MTPKQRLFLRMEGKPVDKIPNLNIVMLFAAEYAGIKYGQFCSDYRKLVEAQMRTAEDFQIDILSTMSDPYRETADYGAKIRFCDDDLPICDEIFLKSIKDFEQIRLWNPINSVRMLDRINAIRLFKEKSGNEYPILGWIEGAWAEFNDLTSMDEGMLMLFDEPDAVVQAMEKLTQQGIRCAIAQLDAGADIIGIGDAAASLVSPTTYRQYILPFEKKMVDAIHDCGGKTKLHICGNITHILPDIFTVGSDVVDIDYMVDIREAVTLSNGRCSVCGNLNPVDLIMHMDTML